MRKALEGREEVLDFVIPGGIYDDCRTIRTMHGAYSKTYPDRVVRMAGNPVFPNGTIEVRFREVPGARAVVELDESGAPTCEVTERVADGFRYVKVGKRGRDYPAVRSISLLRPIMENPHSDCEAR